MAAKAQPYIKLRYNAGPLALKRVPSQPIAQENNAIEAIVPTAYAIRYPVAWVRVGSARTGSTARKCELPAKPCRMPIPKAAWA